MRSDRDIVTDAFRSWANGTGYVASIFADDMTWEITGNIRAVYDDEDNSTVIVAWDGEGTTTAGTTYQNTTPGS